MAGIARTHGRPKRKAKALPIEDLELIVALLASPYLLMAKLKHLPTNPLHAAVPLAHGVTRHAAWRKFPHGTA